MRKLLGFVIATALVAPGCADHLPDQDLRILAVTVPGAKLSSEDLWKDFQKDAAAARKQYFGILQQGSFLSVFAHEGESAPVLRGKAVLTRVLCRTIRPPQEFGIDLMFPAPDANATTRQRFERHAIDPVCKGCHAQLDPVGFSFENFDAVGRERSTDAAQAVDTRGSVTLNGAPLELKDSVELSDAIAQSEELRSCVARQVVRFASGRKDQPAEDAFVTEMAALPLAWRSSLLGLFLSYVKSDGFAWRVGQ